MAPLVTGVPAVQKAPEGNGEVPVPVVNLIHRMRKKQPLTFLLEQRQLAAAVPEISQPDPQQTYRLHQHDTVQYRDRCPVDIPALVDE